MMRTVLTVSQLVGCKTSTATIAEEASARFGCLSFKGEEETAAAGAGAAAEALHKTIAFSSGFNPNRPQDGNSQAASNRELPSPTYAVSSHIRIPSSSSSSSSSSLLPFPSSVPSFLPLCLPSPSSAPPYIPPRQASPRPSSRRPMPPPLRLSSPSRLRRRALEAASNQSCLEPLNESQATNSPATLNRDILSSRPPLPPRPSRLRRRVLEAASIQSRLEPSTNQTFQIAFDGSNSASRFWNPFSWINERFSRRLTSTTNSNDQLTALEACNRARRKENVYCSFKTL